MQIPLLEKEGWRVAPGWSGFQEEHIELYPCAYLHNYEPDACIANAFYQDYIDKAPLFLKNDAKKLRDFIKTHVRYGDKDQIMYRIDHGRIKPSKNLADHPTGIHHDRRAEDRLRNGPDRGREVDARWQARLDC